MINESRGAYSTGQFVPFSANFLRDLCIPTLLIWGLLVLWTFLNVLIPGVNEPHYFSKSLHYWNPDWCRNDMFLTSSNPHLFFYQTFGALTTFYSLHESVIVGRILGLLIVAAGFQRLALSVTSSRWGGVLAVSPFLLLHSIGNFSGEWLIGGIESKVPAYGLLFWSLGAIFSGRYLSAGVAAGLAISFHPIVGIWGVICAGLAALCFRYPTLKRDLLNPDRQVLWGLLLMLLCSLPGLSAAFHSLQSASAADSLKADVIQVGSRLSHHLDPMKFSNLAYWYIASLAIIQWFFLRDVPETRELKFWRWFIRATILVAICGFLIGLGARPITEMWGYEWRVRLLKFYPFRLADLIIPLSASMALVISFRNYFERSLTGFIHELLYVAALGLMYLTSFFIPFPDENPSRMTAQQRADWMQICEQIQNETPESSLVHASQNGWAVKWFTHRAEYVNYKDMPQDAESILKWNERLWTISRWREAALQDQVIDRSELSDLRAQTGIDYLIENKKSRFEVKPVFEVGGFRVFKLQD